MNEEQAHVPRSKPRVFVPALLLAFAISTAAAIGLHRWVDPARKALRILGDDAELVEINPLADIPSAVISLGPGSDLEQQLEGTENFSFQGREFIHTQAKRDAIDSWVFQLNKSSHAILSQPDLYRGDWLLMVLEGTSENPHGRAAK